LVRLIDVRTRRLSAGEHLPRRAGLRGARRGSRPTPEDLSIDTKGDTLQISGKRNTETNNGTPHRLERWNGEFKRVVQLPQDADLSRAEASYRHGVLSVAVPQREESKPRRIAVQS
jgi:HSP20 family protein